MTQAKYSPLECRSWTCLRNVLPKCNACPASGRQAGSKTRVWLLPYKQWSCNYKPHCIFHLVTKATFFRLPHREPLEHRLKIELAATGRPSRRSLTFIPSRGITQTFIIALHTKMAGQNRILRKETQLYILWRNEIKCWYFDEAHTSGGIHTYI
jgi:hypothetical protein